MSPQFKHPHSQSRIAPPEARASKGPHYKAEHGGVAMCAKCHAFYYAKSWHHSADLLTPREARRLKITFTLCPADKMIVDGLYEGELLIENAPPRLHLELLNLIKQFGARAYARDCQHRIIGIRRVKNVFIVTTTENQLAQKLARKIKDVFNKVTLAVSHSREPHETERVRATFLSA